jgi:hypothetical protein
MKYKVEPVTINFRNYVSGYFLCNYVSGYLIRLYMLKHRYILDLINRLYYISSKYQ